MTGAPGTTLRDDIEAAAGSHTLWGAFVSSDSPHIAEMMGRSGFDWLVVDTQHAPVSGSGNLASMITAAGIAGSRVLVRIPWKTDFAAAMWALDAGADGVLAPMVDSAEEAAAIAGASRYPPDGFRSFGPWRVSQQYPSYNTDIGDRRALCLVQIETRGGLNSLEAILAVPGIDGVYIGPQDLSISHGAGLSWRTDNGALHEMSEQVLAAAREAGKVAVAHTADIGDALHWAALGFQMVTATSDFRLLTVGVQEAVETLRGGSAAREPGHSPSVDDSSGSGNGRVSYP